MNIEQQIEKKVKDHFDDPIIRRVFRYDDIAADIVDSRATDALAERKEIFALSMYDFSANRRLSESLPLLSFIAVRDNDESMIKKIKAQLEEMSTWSPLQRPGYTQYHPGPPPKADHNDGSWLATGVGVWAIVEALRILDGNVETDLRKRLDTLLAQEIQSIFDDYRTQLQWFTKGNGAPACNQWVLPLCGIVEAALHLKTHTSDHAGQYEMAIANLNRSLDTQGDSGDFVEGFSYASLTLTNWLRAARMAANAGDDRLSSHPYLPKFTEWLGQMILPGMWTLNACDCGVTRLDEPVKLEPVRELAAELALATQTAKSSWLTGHLGLPPSVSGIDAEKLLSDITPEPPGTATHMNSLGIIAWRTGWAETDHAIWIRTSGGLASHTHADSAHISCYRSGEPILIEAGTPVYGHTDIGRSFASAAGHNVLQLGSEWPEQYMQRREIPGWQRKDTPVELVRNSVRAEGGRVEMIVDPTGYDDLERWHRTCEWNRDGDLSIQDAVKLKSANITVFRFHLGVAATIISTSPREAVLELGSSRILLESTDNIHIDLLTWPGPDERIGDHECPSSPEYRKNHRVRTIHQHHIEIEETARYI